QSNRLRPAVVTKRLLLTQRQIKRRPPHIELGSGGFINLKSPRVIQAFDDAGIRLGNMLYVELAQRAQNKVSAFRAAGMIDGVFIRLRPVKTQQETSARVSRSECVSGKQVGVQLAHERNVLRIVVFFLSQHVRDRITTLTGVTLSQFLFCKMTELMAGDRQVPNGTLGKTDANDLGHIMKELSDGQHCEALPGNVTTVTELRQKRIGDATQTEIHAG